MRIYMQKLKTNTGLLPLIAAAALFFASCSGDGRTAADSIAGAEDAFNRCEYAEAASICDSIFKSADFDALGAGRLCRLAMLCVRMGEAGVADGDEATALAVRSLSAAVLADSDSVAAFIIQLPVEDRGRMMLINSISRTRLNPVDISEYHEEPMQ